MNAAGEMFQPAIYVLARLHSRSLPTWGSLVWQVCRYFHGMRDFPVSPKGILYFCIFLVLFSAAIEV
jgi:hypothetical protein